MSFAMLEEDAVTKRPVSMRTPVINVHTHMYLTVSPFNGAYLHCEPLQLHSDAGLQCNDFRAVPAAMLHYCYACTTVLNAATCHVLRKPMT
jgi:hypothetical protein